jgi:hypothetical protein
MAGYIIYSLDADKFQSFVNNPTHKQLLAFAGLISDGLDDNDGAFDDGDPVQDWPSEPEELCPLVKGRLARPDWYGDLSDVASDIWCNAVFSFCCQTQPKEVGFRVDNDGVYWDVIELAWKQLKVDQDQISPDVALSAFGKRPYRYHPSAEVAKSRPIEANDEDDDDEGEDEDDYDFEDWAPMHSMHSPEEVQKMLEELKAVGPAIGSSRNKQAIGDYDALIQVLEKLSRENRMLFVQVDT